MKLTVTVVLVLLSAFSFTGCTTTPVDIPQARSSVLDINQEQGVIAPPSSQPSKYTPNQGNPSQSTSYSRPQIARIKQNKKRLALIIGNSSYTSMGASLRNPVNDAKAINTALRTLGFHVIKHENARQRQMKKAIDEFGKKLSKYDVGLFFYAGHGVQVNGNNYLIPSDAELNSKDDVEYNCVRADRVLAKMESSGSKTNIIILDACRNNPFERSWTRSVRGIGLAFMNAPSGSLIAYATAPGNTAEDGRGKNGTYTSALLKYINIPNITIVEMFQKVRRDVIAQTNERQTPWESTSLVGNFYFDQRR